MLHVKVIHLGGEGELASLKFIQLVYSVSESYNQPHSKRVAIITIFHPKYVKF